MSEFFELAQSVKDLIENAVKSRALAVEELTERQLLDAFEQAILSGDFMRCLEFSSDRQTVTYVPYRENGILRDRIRELEKIILKKIDPEESILDAEDKR